MISETLRFFMYTWYSALWEKDFFFELAVFWMVICFKLEICMYFGPYLHEESDDVTIRSGKDTLLLDKVLLVAYLMGAQR